VPFFTENKVVFRVDLGDDSAVGQFVRLRVARQIEIHQLFEIGAAGHKGYILSQPAPVFRCKLMDWLPSLKPLRYAFLRQLPAWRTAGSSRAA